jgi:hypothetical protein
VDDPHLRLASAPSPSRPAAPGRCSCSWRPSCHLP